MNNAPVTDMQPDLEVFLKQDANRMRRFFSDITLSCYRYISFDGW